MTGFKALLKKELKEQLRTYRLLIVAAVFALLGMATPLMIKYLPELMRLAGEEIRIEFPTPTAVQALKEYAGTITEVGLLVAVLIGMGSVARERERGTAAMVLSKPVSRGAFIVAKLVGMGATLSAGLVAGAFASYLYTVVLFGQIDALAFLGLNLLLWLFLMMCLSATLFFSSLFKSQLAAGGLALAFLIGQALASGLPVVGRFFPAETVAWGMRLVSGAGGSNWAAMVATAGVLLLGVLLSWLALNRKEL